MNAQANKIAADALQITVDAVEAATGNPVAAIDALPAIRDLLEQLVVLLPPIDATDLQPDARAAADADAQTDVDAKFPKS